MLINRLEGFSLPVVMFSTYKESALVTTDKHLYLPRPIIATVFDRSKKIIKRYYFKRLKTALPRCLFYAMDLEPGFTIQLNHAVNNAWIGDMVVKVGGKINTHYVWDET